MLVKKPVVRTEICKTTITQQQTTIHFTELNMIVVMHFNFHFTNKRYIYNQNEFSSLTTE